MSRKTKILVVLSNMLLIPAIVFAEENDSYSIIASVLNAILSALSWFGYAIALGILIWIGIKYMLSGANERANLKGTASKYLIGVALIVLCSTVAGGVAEIAGKSGDNTASGIVDKGFQLGGITVGPGSSAGMPTNTEGLTYEDGRWYNEYGEEVIFGTGEKDFDEEYDGKKETYGDGKVEVDTSQGATVNGSISEDGTTGYFTASAENDLEQTFDHWNIVYPDGHVEQSMKRELTMDLSMDGKYTLAPVYYYQ